MVNHQGLQAFLDTRAPRIAELRAQYQAGWPWSLGGCLFAVVIPFTVMVVIIARADEWSGMSWFRPAAIGAAVVALACVVIGVRLYAHGQKIFAPVDALADEHIIRPYAALLVEGATLEFPDNTILEWRGSLLFTKTSHVHDNSGKTTRVHGRIAGLPAVVDEIYIRYSTQGKVNPTFGGWVVRGTLPFAGGGVVRSTLLFAVSVHLRIRVPMYGYESLMWQEGFQPLEEATTRLGTGQKVEAAAPGVTPEGAESPTSPHGVPVHALLTDALFEQLRAAPKLELAVAGNTLWVLVEGIRTFDNRLTLATLNADTARKTAERVDRVEAIAREMVRAGGGA